MKKIKLILLVIFCAIGMNAFAQRQFYVYINLDVTPTIEEDNQQFYDVCIGDTITFVATEEFINNGEAIQDDSIPDYRFYWMMTEGDHLAYMWYDTIQLGVGRVFKYAFSSGGGYEVKCRAWSSSFIFNSNDNAIRFRVSDAPNISLTSNRQYICADTEVDFEARAIEHEPWIAARSGFIKRELRTIPTPNYYYTGSFIIINEFQNGTRIQTVDDIDHVYLNIEHSRYTPPVFVQLSWGKGAICDSSSDT